MEKYEPPTEQMTEQDMKERAVFLANIMNSKDENDGFKAFRDLAKKFLKHAVYKIEDAEEE